MGIAIHGYRDLRSLLLTTTKAERMDELTAASAQSVRLVVAFTKGRGTLGYLEVSWRCLISDFVKHFRTYSSWANRSVCFEQSQLWE